MILDTSAVVAILRREDDAARLNAALASAMRPAMSAATLVEASLVIEGRGGRAAGDGLDDLVDTFKVEIAPVTAETARHAREAWRRWGRGRHPARLNLGDCFAYALAMERDQPLLFKGDDFAQTDVRRAV